MGVKVEDIISFEYIVKLSYKNCEVTIKRFGKVVDLTIVNISGKGYIIEKNKTFIIGQSYNHLLKDINENIHYIEIIYTDLIEKGIRNNSKITDFEEY